MMIQYVTTMTRRGQIAIPAEVRRQLGLQPGDRVVLEVDGQEVRLKSVRWTLESVAGSVVPLSDVPEDLDERIRQAKEEVAQRYFRKMTDP
jgi:AbrB family looped-hinge helix DNA binding protein